MAWSHSKVLSLVPRWSGPTYIGEILCGSINYLYYGLFVQLIEQLAVIENPNVFYSVTSGPTVCRSNIRVLFILKLYNDQP